MKKIILASLVLSAFVFGCKKKDTSTTPDTSSSTTGGTTGTPAGVDVNSAPQASFMVDGVSKSYVTDGNVIFDGSGSSGSGSGSTSYSADIDDGNTISYISISKGTLTYGTSYPTDANFKAFFPVAAIPYSTNGVNGVEITIYDAATSSYWSTSFGTANQTGSTFNIVQNKDNQGISNYYLKFKATFSCKVYSATGTASKTITNGVFVGNFGNI